MKSQIQILKTLIFTGLFAFNCTTVAHAKPKDKDRWNKKYDKETYIFWEKPIPFILTTARVIPPLTIKRAAAPERDVAGGRNQKPKVVKFMPDHNGKNRIS